MIAPCTKLDQTVNQIRLLFAIGSREAIIKNTPSVAYTPKIISRYSARPPACHAQPDCQTIVSGHMPKVNINPTINKATRRYLMRSDSVMCSPFFGDQLAYALQRTPRSLDESGITEKRFRGNCELMRVKTSPLFELARVLVRLDHGQKPHGFLNRAAFYWRIIPAA